MKLVTTKDGSQTVYVSSIDETYHSINGAVSESLHVYINSGFNYLCNQGLNNIRLMEIGFGTGLNAFLTLMESIKNKINVEYTALEPYPLDQAIIKKLNYGKDMGHDEEVKFAQLHETTWERRTKITENFTLLKLKSKLEAFDPRSAKYNLVYFDAFASGKQPKIWSLENMTKLSRSMEEKGVFVTYSAMGKLKRDLRLAGFEVESLPGAIGKREMVRGTLSTGEIVD
jgi:tRNA U34 5-methylaminomethyl-2-thiouridine-forming methyltransferase MnmC